MARTQRTTQTPPCSHPTVERHAHTFYRFRCTVCRALVSELSDAARTQMQPQKNHARTLAVR